MLFTTPQMIDHYRLALLRLVGGLFAMAGIVPGGAAVETVPRRVRKAIFRALRQAESAARRLVFIEARGIDVAPYVPREVRGKAAPKKGGGDAKMSRAPRIPQFQLIDPRKDCIELYPHRKPRRAPRKRRTERQLLLRISHFDGRPDYEVWVDADPEILPDDPMNGVPLSRRLQALHHALSDLPKQAERMAREMAKRAVAKPGPGSRLPLRVGAPPGYRKRQVHPVDAILHECARLVDRPPDTS